MVRIFSSLALLALALVVADLVWGLCAGDFNGDWRKARSARQALMELEDAPGAADPGALRQQQDAEQATHQAFLITRTWARGHMLLGLAAVLMGVFVNSLAVTYFVGTSRWCKEVVETYQLDTAWIQQGLTIKRRSFPWSLLGMVWLGIAAGTGAASDPGTLLPNSAEWVDWHRWIAYATPVVLAVAFARQWTSIRSNQVLLASIMGDVQSARAARGLPTPAG